jgi:hypothetical protein
MSSSPLMWVFHLSCGTPGFLLEILGKLIVGIIEGIGEASKG